MVGGEAGRRGAVRAADVAARARVSIATVSLVANGKAAGRVSEGTTRRVRAAIEELGYVVNPAARSLATGRRQAVALVARDMTNPFISAIAAGVAAALGDETQLLLAVSGADGGPPDVEGVVNFGVDGVLLDVPAVAGGGRPAPPCPVVLLDDPAAPAGEPSVCFDLRAGARELAAHLAELGHRTFVYLDTPRRASTFQRRRRHLTDELRRRDPRIRVLKAASDIDIAAARAVAAAAWPGWERDGVTAIVAASDVQAYGVLAALAELGVPVPGRVSVASFDDLPFAAIASPPLTAIGLSAFDLGFEGATLLREVVERGESAHRSVLLPTRLTVRGSTASAPRDALRDGSSNA